jgi:hypothetical protein
MFSSAPPFETVAVPEKQAATGIVAPTPYDPGDTPVGVTIRTSTGNACAGETTLTTASTTTASDAPTKRENRFFQPNPNIAYLQLIREPLINQKPTLSSIRNPVVPRLSVRVT